MKYNYQYQISIIHKGKKQRPKEIIITSLPQKTGQAIISLQEDSQQIYLQELTVMNYLMYEFYQLFYILLSMYDDIKQDICLKQLFIKVKGQGSIESQDSVVECTEFQFNNPVEKIVISNSQNKLIAIEEDSYIKQINVKNLKKDFVFNSGHSSYFPIKALEYTKNHNYFYLCNGSQLKSFQANNGKIKQISSIINKEFRTLRQIFVEDDHFIFAAIPRYILQYSIYTKQLLKQYEINNSYNDNCFDFSVQDQALVSQSSDSIKLWFIKENTLITKKNQSNFCQFMRLYKRQIYEASQNLPDQFFMLSIYQITQDNKEIVLINTIRIYDNFHFLCTMYSMEKIYQTLYNFDITSQLCQSFSISQIDNSYKYLAIIEKQIYIRNKNSKNLTNEFLSVK
ncbi:hypothetical protein pb186bvf_002102 [Paramecium bursaria]